MDPIYFLALPRIHIFFLSVVVAQLSIGWCRKARHKCLTYAEDGFWSWPARRQVYYEEPAYDGLLPVFCDEPQSQATLNGYRYDR